MQEKGVTLSLGNLSGNKCHVKRYNIISKIYMCKKGLSYLSKSINKVM